MDTENVTISIKYNTSDAVLQEIKSGLGLQFTPFLICICRKANVRCGTVKHCISFGRASPQLFSHPWLQPAVDRGAEKGRHKLHLSHTAKSELRSLPSEESYRMYWEGGRKES